MDRYSISPVDPKDLRAAQLKMVYILKEIDRICEKHDIKWWINYGTLLGAVRHKGFIPWDDDCDISMLRDDYEKFMLVAPEELGKDFFLQTKATDPFYPKQLTKIRLNNTVLVEVDENVGEKYHQGIFVDIFICDYYPCYAKGLLQIFQIMPGIRQIRKKYPRGSIMRAVLGILTAIPYTVHSLMEKLFNFIWSFSRRNRNLKYLATEVCLCDGIVHEPKNVFPLKRELCFEGNIFPTPNNYDAVLRNEYGDYMQMPPVEKRVFHAKQIRV